ncbi:hypothetical protein [Yoonia sp. SDW83-1]|uniref:hypothetical protein n=1 Tax=Yoonia sp. SDW83-1 TaxID=3366945 RepID=UPI00398C7F8D
MKGKGFVIWFFEDSQYSALEVTRTAPPISKKEWLPFMSFRKIGPALINSREVNQENLSATLQNNINRYSMRYSLGGMLVAHSLAGPTSTGIYTPALLLSELQGLALQSYEGSRCNSGFIFYSQPQEHFEQIEKAGFQVERFDGNVHLEPGFFSSTISHRYVDGRNSFYIVDNHRRIYGIATVKRPGDFSLYDRAMFRHVNGILDTTNGRMFSAFVGRNADVVIYSKGKAMYRWSKLSWKIVDMDMIYDILKSETYLSDGETEALLSALMVCSDLRFGTLVLVLSGSNIPSFIGKIDKSDLSTHIFKVNEQRKISDIVSSGAAFGILTSDGMTTVSMDGEVVSSGDILDLATDKTIRYEGGGRTQAAQVASYFGLAIKVSEDGPLSLFKNGEKIAEFVI